MSAIEELKRPRKESGAGGDKGRAPDGRPICYRCGETGHIRKHCSQPPTEKEKQKMKEYTQRKQQEAAEKKKISEN